MILPLGKTRSRLAFDAPNARIEGRGRTDSQKTGQSVTPRPLECRVRLLALDLGFCFRSYYNLVTIRRNTRSSAIAPYRAVFYFFSRENNLSIFSSIKELIILNTSKYVEYPLS